MMRRILTTTCIIFLITATYSLAQTTYYSTGTTNAWNLTSSWSPAAVPTRTDHVVIQNGHTITVSGTGDNGSTGVSPDGLNRGNVGPFTTSDLLEFYHTGDITVEVGGTLDATERMMLEGTVTINGSYTTTSDVVVLGKFNVTSGATFSSDDDLILSGGSRTIIDATISLDDDVYLDHTDVLLCGTGLIYVGNGPGVAIPGEIQLLNGASTNQICDGFQIECNTGIPANCTGGTVALPFTGSSGFSFDLTQFNYVKTITIDNTKVTGDLTNFPVLISITNESTLETTANAGGVESANGYDIVFATADDCGVLTQLDHQLESYDGSSGAGTIVAWVKVPAVSSTVDTDIYMYYGNSAVTQNLSVTTTFDYDYISVWHMEEDPAGAAPQVLDATSTGNDATSNGIMSGNVTGQIANGIDFDGTDDYLQTPSSELQTENNFTLSLWFNPDNTNVSHLLWEGVNGQNGWGGNIGAAQEMNLSIGYCCALVNDRISLFLGDIEEETNTNVLSIDGGAFNSTGSWHYVAGTFADMNSSPLAELWLDNATTPVSNTGVNDSYTARNLWNTNLRIGISGNTGQRIFNGQIDEVRISKIVRSDDWIQTEYNNQSDPSTFFTVAAGAQSINQCGPLPIELKYFRGKIKDQKVLLEWATAAEINNDYFTLERSADGLDFHELTTVPGAGNSSVTLNYSYTDKNPFFGISYYRLKQTDYDGQFEYFNVIAVKFERGLQGLDFTLFPNPTKDKLSVQVTGNAVLDFNIEIYNAQGQKIKNVIASRKIDGFELDVAHLNAGIYLVHLINEKYQGVRKFYKR